jgi:hypothetical protein
LFFKASHISVCLISAIFLFLLLPFKFKLDQFFGCCCFGQQQNLNRKNLPGIKNIKQTVHWLIKSIPPS